MLGSRRFRVVTTAAILAMAAPSIAPAAEIVSFTSSDGVVLQGTLELPTTAGRSPLLVFVHGSGPVTRAAYQEYVARFLPQGYAVFRYDKRGVGASGGQYSGVSVRNSGDLLVQLAADANAAVQTLKTYSTIDSTRIVLIGASQAGWIIPVACTLSNNVAYAVNVVGPTVSVGEEIYYSSYAEGSRLDFDTLSQLLAAFTGEHGFDPVPFLRRMPQRSIWLLGGRDRSIPTRESVAILEHLVTDEGKRFTMRLYPDANHGLINLVSGHSEPYLDEIIAWLRPLVAIQGATWSSLKSKFRDPR